MRALNTANIESRIQSLHSHTISSKVRIFCARYYQLSYYSCSILVLLIVVDEDKKAIDTAININKIEQELMEK